MNLDFDRLDTAEYTVPFQSAEFTNIDEYCIKNSIQFPSYRTETIIIRLT